MDLLTELADMFPDTLVAQAGSTDAFGAFTASGAAVSHAAQVTGDVRLVRDASGQEVVSSVKVIVAGAPGLTVEGHRYTLPSRFSPGTALQAIRVDHYTDESGPCYETIRFP